MHARLLFLIFTQVEELNSEIEALSAAFAKAKEAPQKAQTQKFQVSVALFEVALPVMPQEEPRELRGVMRTDLAQPDGRSLSRSCGPLASPILSLM